MYTYPHMKLTLSLPCHAAKAISEEAENKIKDPKPRTRQWKNLSSSSHTQPRYTTLHFINKGVGKEKCLQYIFKCNSWLSSVRGVCLDCKMTELWIPLAAHESEPQVPSAWSGSPHSSHYRRTLFGRWVGSSMAPSAVHMHGLCAFSLVSQARLSSQSLAIKSCVCKPKLILYSNNPQGILCAAR